VRPRAEAEVGNARAAEDRWPNLRLVTTRPMKDPRRMDRYREIIVSA